MSKAVGPIPKDRVSRPVPGPARHVAPSPKPVAAPEPTKRRGAPVKELRKPVVEEPAIDENQEELFPDGEQTESEVVEEEEIIEEEEEGLNVAQENEILEGELQEVEEEAPKAAKNPNPTPTVRRPPAPVKQAPRTQDEKRVASGNVRPGKDLAHRNANQQMQTAVKPGASSALKGDIIIPRILLMQGSSQLVKDRKAQVGDIVRSSNGERLGGSNGPDAPADAVDVIPLALSQSWTIMSGDGKTFIRTEPRTAANDNDPWEFEGEDGQTYKRLKTVDAIVMVSSDIDRLSQDGGVAVDEDGIPLDLDSSIVLPHAISFKSTGFQAGKGISTFFARVEALMKSHPLTRPYHFTLPLSCFSQEDEGNEWHVFDVGAAKRTPGHLVQEARQWFDTLSTRNIVLEDEAQAEKQADSVTKAAPKKRAQF